MNTNALTSHVRSKITLAGFVIILFGAAIIPVMSKTSATPVQAEQRYVLTAGRWGTIQTQAVLLSGGAVTFSHRQSGIGFVTASAHDFLSRALATGVFTGGAADQMVQWQPPAHEVEFDQNTVTPSDETFINLQWNIRAIEAADAWAAGFTGEGVCVAVIDGGLYNSHADLDANVDVVHSRSFVSGFAFNQDVGTFWHATHVAGIIAAEDNALGTIGVARRPQSLG